MTETAQHETLNDAEAFDANAALHNPDLLYTYMVDQQRVYDVAHATNPDIPENNLQDRIHQGTGEVVQQIAVPEGRVLASRDAARHFAENGAELAREVDMFYTLGRGDLRTTREQLTTARDYVDSVLGSITQIEYAVDRYALVQSPSRLSEVEYPLQALRSLRYDYEGRHRNPNYAAAEKIEHAATSFAQSKSKDEELGHGVRGTLRTLQSQEEMPSILHENPNQVVGAVVERSARTVKEHQESANSEYTARTQAIRQVGTDAAGLEDTLMNVSGLTHTVRQELLSHNAYMLYQSLEEVGGRIGQLQQSADEARYNPGAVEQYHSHTHSFFNTLEDLKARCQTEKQRLDEAITHVTTAEQLADTQNAQRQITLIQEQINTLRNGSHNTVQPMGSLLAVPEQAAHDSTENEQTETTEQAVEVDQTQDTEQTTKGVAENTNHTAGESDQDIESVEPVVVDKEVEPGITVVNARDAVQNALSESIPVEGLGEQADETGEPHQQEASSDSETIPEQSAYVGKRRKSANSNPEATPAADESESQEVSETVPEVATTESEQQQEEETQANQELEQPSETEGYQAKHRGQAATNESVVEVPQGGRRRLPINPLQQLRNAVLRRRPVGRFRNPGQS